MRYRRIPRLIAAGLTLAIGMALRAQAQTPTITEFPTPASSSYPEQIVSGPDGNLWLAEGAGRIAKVSTSGTFTEFSDPARITAPVAITAGPDGALWYTDDGPFDPVTDTSTSNIGRITTSGAVTVYALRQYAFANGIATGSDGNLWFTEVFFLPDGSLGPAAIARITPAGVITEFPVPADVEPSQIIAGPDGNLWFTLRTLGARIGVPGIGQVTSSGTVTIFPIPTATVGNQMAIGSDGNIWFTEPLVSQIAKVTPSGDVTEYAIPSGNAARGITPGPDGNLWFSETNANNVGVMSVDGTVLSEFPVPTPASQPDTMTLGPDGQVWLLEFAASKVAELSLETQRWIPLSPTGGSPLGRYSHTAVSDPATDRMVIFGGACCSAFVPTMLNDVWVLDRADGFGGAPAWTPLNPPGTVPSARGFHSSVYDPVTNEMIIFGGNQSIAYCFNEVNDVWILSNANGFGGAPSWRQLTPVGGPPSPRDLHSAVYDAASNRMIVFGGRVECSSSNGEVWVLANANGFGGTPAWTQLGPTGGPGALIYHSAVYDAANNRMIVFGGYANDTNVSADVWVLSNANGLGGTPFWQQLAPAGAFPSARYLHSATYDQESNRMTIAGGTGPGCPNSYCDDVWVLSGANGLGENPTWTQLSPGGGTPAPRAAHSAVWNAASDRMTIFGGASSSVPGLSDVWVLTGADGCVSPVAATSGATEICTGSSTTLTGSGGVSCSWAPITGLSDPTSCSPVASPSSSTTYSLVVTDADGCASKNEAGVTVIVNPIPPTPTITPGGATTFCAGGNVTLTSSSASGNQWYVGGIPIDGATSQEFIAAATGTYTVVVTSIGCSSAASDGTTITVNPLPTAVVSGTATICAGGSTTIQAALTGAGPWNVTWSDGAIQNGVTASPVTRSVTPIATTVYTVTSVSDSKCTGTSEGGAVVTVEPHPKATVSGSATICVGSSATIQAVLTGTAPWHLTWSDGFAQTVLVGLVARTVSPSVTTSYSVTALSDAACTGSGSGLANIKVNPLPSATIAAPARVCAGSAGNPAVVPSAGGGATYAWAITNGIITSGAGTRGITFTAASSGSVGLTASVKDSAGCSASGSVSIPIDPMPSAGITVPSIVCHNSTGNIASVPDAGPGAAYIWTIKGGTITAGAGSRTMTFSAGKQGSVALSVTVTNGTGCSAGATATITINKGC